MVEYLYVDLGRGASLAGADTTFKTNIVRARLNYRFLSRSRTHRKAKPRIKLRGFCAVLRVARD